MDKEHYLRLRIHPERPATRPLAQAVERLQHGSFIVVPTETTYALVARPDAYNALAAIRNLRRLDPHHLWSLMCSDLSQAALFVHIDNAAHRILRRLLPGPYTFILPANSRLPKRIFGKRRDMGVRIPQLPLTHQLLTMMGEPLLATTMQMVDEPQPEIDSDRIDSLLQRLDCLFIDSGWGGTEPTTVIDLCGDAPELMRRGLGAWPTDA
ncbi:MAG: L-threonylcarbamoyladenylate synthase [Mariprofundales bacterium]|nr:L-threonylcarbamoyladenylate synthase [Mariprofundales bacterium]